MHEEPVNITLNTSLLSKEPYKRLKSPIQQKQFLISEPKAVKSTEEPLRERMKRSPLSRCVKPSPLTALVHRRPWAEV